MTIDDIRLVDMKVLLVCEWDRWSSPAAIGLNRDIEDFLARNGIDANAGLTLSTRIAKYLSRKLGLLEGALAKKIYAWRLLIVMADVFGAGIYIFISRSLFTYYNKIRATDSIKKGEKVPYYSACCCRRASRPFRDLQGIIHIYRPARPKTPSSW